ncbi:hypothetical protein B0T17DRAFT_14910 [Bombardia bombarda]|uniref:EKC/KEOPS complex subunit GON7 n=1 Tax=Bombardia bombarda TaxID=252184 RepID=A0AA40CER1_9PEZI|nr:hypothetical protein B0T17DRAFT_14910 [Bombardia bombarda]
MAQQDTAAGAAMSAVYTSATGSNEPFSVSEPLTPPATQTVESKSQYLHDLRTATAAIQERVNQELTARMEEDNRAAGVAAGAADAKEEETYGEEVQEEED